MEQSQGPRSHRDDGPPDDEPQAQLADGMQGSVIGLALVVGLSGETVDDHCHGSMSTAAVGRRETVHAQHADRERDDEHSPPEP